MIEREDLKAYLHDYLACATFNDYSPNGLQIEGRSTISKICTAVTASESAIDYAIANNADALIVHHGFFWRAEDSLIKGIKRIRFSKLLNNDINLFAYHLPLDCHPQIGNNFLLANILGIDSISSHTINKIPNLLWQGTFKNPFNPQDFCEHIDKKLFRKPLHIEGKSNQIKNIAWCTGAAQDLIETAAEHEIDAFLSGEASERTFYQAKELGIHYYACGHHATERYGIQKLGQHLQTKFSIAHEFFDANNPI